MAEEPLIGPQQPTKPELHAKSMWFYARWAVTGIVLVCLISMTVRALTYDIPNIILDKKCTAWAYEHPNRTLHITSVIEMEGLAKQLKIPLQGIFQDSADNASVRAAPP